MAFGPGTRVVSKRTGNYGTVRCFQYQMLFEEAGYRVIWDGEEEIWWVPKSGLRRLTPLEEIAGQAE